MLQDKLKKEFTRLWTGELAAVVSFWFCFFCFKINLERTFTVILSQEMLISILYQLFVLSIILIQGSIYWLILLKRLSVPQYAKSNTGKIYRVLKIVNVVLLGLGIVIMIINYSNIGVLIISVFIWLFAVIEWINYFEWRLAYSYNPLILLGHIMNGTLSKSRIAREISDCERE